MRRENTEAIARAHDLADRFVTTGVWLPKFGRSFELCISRCILEIAHTSEFSMTRLPIKTERMPPTLDGLWPGTMTTRRVIAVYPRDTLSAEYEHARAHSNSRHIGYIRQDVCAHHCPPKRCIAPVSDTIRGYGALGAQEYSLVVLTDPHPPIQGS